MSYQLHHGDCLKVLRTLPSVSVDAVVTDPPYGLSFMGKRWDYDVPSIDVWAECLRVLKPGGYLLAFAGTRTQHRMASRIEDAGFEIRDMIAWVYGSGFPKSKNLGNGVGSALKPALEPITMARKPFNGSLDKNYMEYGTGGLNIDGCRVPSGPDHAKKCASVVGLSSPRNVNTFGMDCRPREDSYNESGRFPANLIHDGSPEVVSLFPDSSGAGGSTPNVKITGYGDGIGTGSSSYLGGERKIFASGSGSAARFFYCPKASRADRNEGLFSGGKPAVGTSATMREREDADWSKRNGNHHPTVKPTDLMAYLCRLITPPRRRVVNPDGSTAFYIPVVMDPFMGSGSTGKACMLEGFNFIGIEREAEYVEIAEARCKQALALRLREQAQADMFGGDTA